MENYINNMYSLANVEKDGENINFRIVLNANSKIVNLYLTEYFQGVYIGSKEQKYNIYAYVQDNEIFCEITKDFFINNACDKEKNLQKIWIRNRIGNTYTECPVIINVDNAEIIYGYRNVYNFIKEDTFQFYYVKLQNESKNTHNPLYEIKLLNDKQKNNKLRDLRDFEVIIKDNEILLNGVIGEKLSKIIISDDETEETTRENVELCLMWKDKKNKKNYYFHSEVFKNGIVNYTISFEELSQLSVLEPESKQLDWLMVDENNKEYIIYLADSDLEEKVKLPIKDYNATLIRTSSNTIVTDMTTADKFVFGGICSSGTEFILALPRKSYEQKIDKIIAQRVNTEIEYNLPFYKAYEDEDVIHYYVKLDFNCEESDFKEGVHQFWVETDTGVEEKRSLLKLERLYPITENYYFPTDISYSVIGEHAYESLFYVDSSSTLKMNVQKKKMVILIKNLNVLDDEIVIELMWKKELHFMTLSAVKYIFENGECFDAEFNLLSDNSTRIIIPISKLLTDKPEDSFRLELFFYGISGGVILENNWLCPVVNNRENMSFEVVRQFENGKNLKIWGDFINKAFRIGITENMNIFRAVGLWIYDEDRLCISIEWKDEKTEEKYKDNNFSLFFRNKLSGELIKAKRELVEDGEIIYYLQISELALGKYLPIVVCDNGQISYCDMTFSGFSVISYKTDRKAIIEKERNAVNIEIAELLIYENEIRKQECKAIIEKARLESKEHENQKIWLIGENLGLSARDNGLAFFEYCMNNAEIVDAKVFFVTKKENEDISALDSYKDSVLFYDSDEHIYYDELAEFYVVSHGIRDVMPSLYHDNIGKFRKPIIYLQHGISAMKIYGINNKSYGSSIQRFIVSSMEEKKLLIANGQFWEEEMATTGLARYDKLNPLEENHGKYVWIIPTWRDWLMKSERDFLNSDFYKYYSEILSNKDLIACLRKSGQKLVFTLHIEFEKYKSYFTSYENDVVHISDMHEVSIADRVRECSMVCTDYSSIIFDVAYLKKPALFFQFDIEIYNKFRGSYVDMEKELPGKVTYSLSEFITELKKEIQENFKLPYEYNQNISRYFDYYDHDNAKRIYDTIMECRKENDDEY